MGFQATVSVCDRQAQRLAVKPVTRSVGARKAREEIQILNLKAQYLSIKVEVDEAICKVLDRQNFILGAEVAALEEEVALYCGTRHAVGVASGTDALILALKTTGVGPGDEVIVPAFTYVATADSVTMLGATPVFADIDPFTFVLDPDLLEGLMSAKTKAVLPVHLYGHPAPMHWMLPAYNSSKAALNMLTVIQAAQLKDTPIKVNAAHPGSVKTDLNPQGSLNVIEGAETAVTLATLLEDGPTGGFFHRGETLAW